MQGTARENLREEVDPDTAADAIQPEAEPALSDAERSARNIALWSSYLPPECVDKMLEMGWDQST